MGVFEPGFDRERVGQLKSRTARNIHPRGNRWKPEALANHSVRGANGCRVDTQEEAIGKNNNDKAGFSRASYSFRYNLDTSTRIDELSTFVEDSVLLSF